MAKKFLSCLGINDYKEEVYEFSQVESGRYRTKFVQEALINTACKDWQEGDKAIIFLTDLARKENWNNEEDETRRLESISKENWHIETIPISIPEGKSEKEIWDIFDIIIDQIDEDDEIIFDITHGLRSIPMVALVIINYAKAVKNAKILGIYYGAWEAKNKDNIVPIFDLTPLDQMLEWSQAVNTFLRYGNSGHLRDLSNDILRPKLPTEQWARDTRDLIDKLNDFTMGLYTCRGMAVKGSKASKKSIAVASKEVEEKVQKLKEDEIQLKPLMPLICKIEDSIDGFDEKDSLRTGVSTIKWCIDNNLIQQGYTALDETMKSYICVKFNLDPTDYNNREDIVQTALKVRGLDIPEDKWRVKDKYKAQVKEIAYSLDEDLIKLSNKITDKRNDINHFGFNENVVASDDFVRDIKEYYDEFVGYLEKDNLL